MQPIQEHNKAPKLLGQYYWLIQYWTGPIGMDGVFFHRQTFATSAEALEFIEKHGYKQKGYLEKVLC